MPPSPTRSPTRSFEPIEHYPVPWAHVLTSLLGKIAFCVEHVPSRIVHRHWLGIVSSHSSQLGFASSDWQSALQSALHLAQRHGLGILCSTKAPYSGSVIHACRRMNIAWLEIEIEDRSSQTKHSDERSEKQTHSCFQGRVILSKDPKDVSPIPQHDRAVVFLADHRFALNVREGGKISQLLEARLGNVEFQDTSTYVSLNSMISKTSL